LTRAGPEIGVASTKAFTTQLGALWLVTLYLAKVRKALSPKTLKHLSRNLSQVPRWMRLVLKQRKAIEKIAKVYSPYFNFLYIGRGIEYPIALEGALKLKEISYIHAEGYPGGEMKHGSGSYEKILNNMEEVKARSGRLIALIEKGDSEAARKANHVIEIPPMGEDFAPLVSILPLQLLAYEIAKYKKREIDQPRNLAKSVTVE
jgi:glucosamine--fructose-6-phosphate aminotransferase (isomerizing)